MRKKLIKIFLGGAAFIASVPLMAQDTLKLTLKDALDIALSENMTVKVADMEITKTGYAKKGTYAQLFPQISFSFDYQRMIQKQVMYMGEEAIKFGRDNSWSTGFNASLPLVNVALWKSLQITGKDVEVAVEKARESRQDLIDQVQQTFYTTLLAKDSYIVYKENYDNALSDYNDVKAKYEQGSVAKYDLIMAEVTLQNAIPNVYDSKNNIELCLWQLKALMGIDLNANIDCIGSLTDYSEQLEEVSLNADVSLNSNTTLRQLQLQDDILHKSYQAQIASFYPQLSASAYYQWTAMTNDFKFRNYVWNPYSVGAISLTIPIFTGGQRLYSVKQAKVERDQLKLQMENTARELEVSVRQSLSSMDTYIKQYEAAEKSIEGAETGYEIAQERYNVGSGTLLELHDSQLALLQARLNLNQAIYNYLVAKSSLDKVLGVTANDMTPGTQKVMVETAADENIQ